ncbi:MAG TPA: hypothetical protein VLN49_19090 [Gemmatimonadaceae bacterium]|nr:hypothetical protein [Gemmatimonadaceae bacterium]
MLTVRLLSCSMLLLWSAPVAAQSPTRIGVQVQLIADRYRLKFGTRTAAVEAALAGKIDTLLSTRIGFLRFAPAATGDGTAYRLVFTLDRKDRASTGLFQEYGLWARLERPGASPEELYWVTLRPADATSQAIKDEATFLGEVDAKLAHANLSPIVKDLLSKVPITETALPWADPLGWVLPLGSDSLCMKQFTLLTITNELTIGGMSFARRYGASVASLGFSPTAPTPEATPFLRKVFSEPVSLESPTTPLPADVKSELLNALRTGKVKPTQVYVVDYQYDPNACRLQPVAPGSTPTGGGR